jgi:imidazolonepropionase-like amidohydrolase
LHWQQAVADDVKFPRTLAVARHDPLSGTIDRVLDQAKAMQCAVLLPPDLSTLPRSRHLIHPAKLLHDAGIEVGFVLGDNPGTVRMLFFRLMELVRNGLPADVALRGVTLTPAKALGIEARVGSLEVGKDGNLLVFRGDPLSPTGVLTAVWLGGREVPQQP